MKAVTDIPVVILCGGQGTRMRGETRRKKELVEVGGRPIIWHVMRIFSAHGFNRFILTLGYGGEQIKRYFLDYDLLQRDLTIALGADGGGARRLLDSAPHPTWQITLADTGLHTEKGSRIARVAEHLPGERFFVAYGDDVSDINLKALVDFHSRHGRLATITAVQIRLPYGIVEADEAGFVTGFTERPHLPHWINGGFMLFEQAVLDRLHNGDNVSLEQEILPALAADGELMIYRHRGFWRSMNTMKDNIELRRLWDDDPPWRVWE